MDMNENTSEKENEARRFMEEDESKQQPTRRLEEKIARHRRSFRSIAFLSYLNLLLNAIGASLYFPFSVFSPLIPLWFCMGMGGGILSVAGIIGLLIAVAMVSVMLVLFLLSKKHRWATAVGIALMFIDMLVVGWSALFLSGEFDPMFIVDIGFHVWALYELVSLFRRQGELKKLTAASIYEGDFHA